MDNEVPNEIPGLGDWDKKPGENDVEAFAVYSKTAAGIPLKSNSRLLLASSLLLILLVLRSSPI